MILDHLVVGAKSLPEARTYVEDALGVSMQPGGQHAVFHTYNALMGLEDGLYLEAIAADPNAPAPQRPRWYDLDRFTGPARLSNWAAAVTDMTAVLPKMPEGCGAPVAVQRGALNWTMAVSAEGTTPFDNLWPALIMWPIGVHPAPLLKPTGIRLCRMILSHPRGDELLRALSRHLSDDRVRVEVGPVAIHAEFGTPHGVRTL